MRRISYIMIRFLNGSNIRITWTNGLRSFAAIFMPADFRRDGMRAVLVNLQDLLITEASMAHRWSEYNGVSVTIYFNQSSKHHIVVRFKLLNCRIIKSLEAER